MRCSKSNIVLLLLIVSGALWLYQHNETAHARQALAQIETQRVQIEERAAAARALLTAAKQEFNDEQAKRASAYESLDQALRKLRAIHPDSRWAQPPPFLPSWEPDSPYIWLQKESLPRFEVPVFQPDGRLRNELAYVFTIDPAKKQAMDKAIVTILREYRALEFAHAEKLDEHLPGIADRVGPKITIRIQPLPDQGKEYKQRFATALREGVGEQRAGLIQQFASEWINTQFSQFGTEPKTISVLRNPNGTFNISTKSGGLYMSVGGPIDLAQYVPDHFLPLFSELVSSATP